MWVRELVGICVLLSSEIILSLNPTRNLLCVVVCAHSCVTLMHMNDVWDVWSHVLMRFTCVRSFLYSE